MDATLDTIYSSLMNCGSNFLPSFITFGPLGLCILWLAYATPTKSLPNHDPLRDKAVLKTPMRSLRNSYHASCPRKAYAT